MTTIPASDYTRGLRAPASNGTLTVKRTNEGDTWLFNIEDGGTSAEVAVSREAVRGIIHLFNEKAK